MHISFKKVSYKDYDAMVLMTKWSNQEDINYLVNVNFKEESIKPHTVDQLIQGIKNNKTKTTFLIMVDDEPVGEISLDINPPHLACKGVKSGWLGIFIGEAAYRGKGIANQALSFIEQIALEKGCLRMELGVFAFNHRAKQFYSKNGYEQFYTFEDFTYYDGKWHDDYRMEKWLQPIISHKKVTVVAGVLYDQVGRILITRRAREKQLGGYWEFPGGKVESGEMLQTALIREINEELDLNVEVENYIMDTLYQYEFGRIHLFFYDVALVGALPIKLMSTDHDLMLWVYPQDLVQYEFAPADKDVVKRLIDEHSVLS